MKLVKTIALASSLMYASGVTASDIARDVRKANESPLIENGGYFELGIGAKALNQVSVQEDPKDDKDTVYGIGFALGGEYRFKGLFIEASEGSLDGINLGYTLWNNATWQADLIAASVDGSFRSDNDIEETDTEEQRNKKLIERDTLRIGAGVRVTGYLNDHIIQYRLVGDTFDGNGFETSLRFGRHWQYQNWNFHGIVGASYLSAKASRYLWGISEDDATEKFAAYTPSAGVTLQAEFGVTYPMSEHWVFRTTTRYIQFSDEKSDSPLYKDDHLSAIFATINYVF